MATVLALVLLAEYRGVTKHSHDTDTGMGILCARPAKRVRTMTAQQQQDLGQSWHLTCIIRPKSEGFWLHDNAEGGSWSLLGTENHQADLCCTVKTQKSCAGFQQIWRQGNMRFQGQVLGCPVWALQEDERHGGQRLT